VKPVSFRVLHWASRIALSVIFFYTGYIKLESPLQFAAVLSGYQLFPDWLIIPLMDYFPWLEIVLGVLLLFGWKTRGIVAGAIFLCAGYIKLGLPLPNAAPLSGYKSFLDPVIIPLVNHFPWIEIALGALLLIPWKIRHVSTAACGLLASFIAVLTITYLRGIDANCGCFSFDDRITPLTIVRDGLIILPAIYLMVEDALWARFGSAARAVGNRMTQPVN